MCSQIFNYSSINDFQHTLSTSRGLHKTVSDCCTQLMSVLKCCTTVCLISYQTLALYDSNDYNLCDGGARIITMWLAVNPHNLTGWGKITTHAGLYAAISEQHGTDRNPLVTFPKDVWAMRWHNPGMSSPIQDSNMAAAKPESVKLSIESRLKPLYVLFQTKYQCNFNGLTYVFGSSFSLGLIGILCDLTGSERNPRWQPLNFKCM